MRGCPAPWAQLDKAPPCAPAQPPSAVRLLQHTHACPCGNRQLIHATTLICAGGKEPGPWRWAFGSHCWVSGSSTLPSPPSLHSVPLGGGWTHHCSPATGGPPGPGWGPPPPGRGLGTRLSAGPHLPLATSLCTGGRCGSDPRPTGTGSERLLPQPGWDSNLRGVAAARPGSRGPVSGRACPVCPGCGRAADRAASAPPGYG